MDIKGFIDYNTRLSPENSRKAASYARAIMILDEVLPHQNLDSLTLAISLPSHAAGFRMIDIGTGAGFPGVPLKIAFPEIEVTLADRIVAHETDPRTISSKLIAHFDISKEGEDKASLTKQRKGQDYFRRMILANYGGRCALTGIDIPQLLMASHIIPWADKTHKKDRLNPCNGICLSALYDKAFDKGLITVSPDNYTVQLSSALREYESQDYFDKHFGIIEGLSISLPKEYKPNRDFLAYHKDNVFMGI